MWGGGSALSKSPLKILGSLLKEKIDLLKRTNLIKNKRERGTFFCASQEIALRLVSGAKNIQEEGSNILTNFDAPGSVYQKCYF